MFEGIEIEWPKPTDVAFGPGRGDSSNSQIVACIDWLMWPTQISLRAEGFRKAADLVVEGLSEGKSRPFPCDTYFFPVAYLYRHSLELRLKEAISYGVRLDLIERSEKLRDLLNSHNLYGLWNQLKPAIEEFWSGAPRSELAAAERIVSQFHEIDKSSQVFRYPNQKKKTGSTKNHQNLKLVDLEQLSQVAAGLFNFLEGCMSGFDNALSNLPDEYWD